MKIEIFFREKVKTAGKSETEWEMHHCLRGDGRLCLGLTARPVFGLQHYLPLL